MQDTDPTVRGKIGEAPETSLHKNCIEMEGHRGISSSSVLAYVAALEFVGGKRGR